MTIERRYHQRHPCDIDAQLIHRGRSFSVTATDLTAHGMSLKTGYLTIPQGNIVELELCLGEHHWNIDALIAHVSEQRIGIMFRMPQPELLQVVQNPVTSQDVRLNNPVFTHYSGPLSTR